MSRYIFIHGNQCLHWSCPWTIWLKKQLEDMGSETFFETFPDSILARKKYWISFLEQHVHAGKEDILIGWSSGAVAAMRYAEDHSIRGSILISPSYTDLHDDLEKQSGYFDTPWKWKEIRSNQKQIALIYGDDDPYIPQKEFEHIASELHSQVMKIPGGKHFLEYQTFPQVLEYIKNVYGK